MAAVYQGICLGYIIFRSQLRMQQDQAHSNRRHHRGFGDDFRYGKEVDNWEEFKSTWKPTSFQPQLNHFKQQELTSFWETQLDSLTTQNIKICILVPTQVNPPEENRNGNRGKGKKVAKVRLDEKVLRVCQQLIDEKYPSLDYDYASLFLGNDKQLLVYRKCNEIVRYLQKYRLPLNFKDHMKGLESVTSQLYALKIQRNKHISTFNPTSQAKRVQQAYLTTLKQFEDAFNSFKPTFQLILEDFLSKKLCREIVIRSVRDELKEPIQELCKKHNLEIINRFYECTTDEIKDLLVLHQGDYRLVDPDYGDIDEPEEPAQYVYEPVPELKQLPKDIRELQFRGIDFQRQIFCYWVQLPAHQGKSPIEGIFIRSAQHEDRVYELDMEVGTVTQLELQIYPFKKGKSTYDIYTYNSQGFTQCSEKITIFNELRVPGSEEHKYTDYAVHMLGSSESGLLIDRQSTEGIFMPIKHQGVTYRASSLSLGNSMILCDKRGDVAGWGEMYSPSPEEEEKKKLSQDEEKSELEQLLQQNIVIEKPCLLLARRHIRKVSCGSGYSLMLSIFGSVWSMGFNTYGQLGLGHFTTDGECCQPREICGFGSQRAFMVDIKATVCGSSFCWDQKGNLYRWGWNQVDETTLPIQDRFGSTANYTTGGIIIYKSCNPTKVRNSLIRGEIKQVEAGNNFFLALTKQGELYGWGDCAHLGRPIPKDLKEKLVPDIVLPLEILKGVQWVSCGMTHAVVGTRQGRIIAWGDSRGFVVEENMNTFKKHEQLPVDITECVSKGLLSSPLYRIACGNKLTVIASEGGKLIILGESGGFGGKEFECPDKVVDLIVSHEPCLAVLTKK